ncbi:hypothetical protein AB0D57_22680 [Streptomyces sp. NPDC048275]|uniref:hypothetical protein n=1 Tax=Streptomyces sp. NPDC048275 TaxID=3155629 RepID=UPI0033D25A44
MNVDPGSALVVVAFVALPLGIGLLVVKALHLLAARRWFFSRTAEGPGRGLELIALGLGAGLLAYAAGLFVGFDTGGSHDACVRASGSPPKGEGPQGDLTLVEGFLPLSRDCRWSDGTHIDLVPVWVNVVIFAALAGIAVGTALAVRGSMRRRTARTTAPRTRHQAQERTR